MVQYVDTFEDFKKNNFKIDDQFIMKKISFSIITILLLLFSSSCEKGFEELNQNPFAPTETGIGQLFNTVVGSLQLGWNEQFYMHNETLYPLTQLAALTTSTFPNVSLGTEDMWSNYYKALAHIREIEQRLNEMEETTEAEALNNVRGMLKILTAYKTFRVTDMFGDLPFFEAGQGYQDLDLARPKFDRQEDIYKFLLDELAWAAENININPEPVTEGGTPYLSLESFDTFFSGNLYTWIKFANALRLRHAMRMVEKDPAFATPILKEIIENNLPVIGQGEDVVMLPSAQSWQRESSHWSFREHNNLRMGSNIWGVLSETDASDGSGIFDPRAYLFFETNNANEWTAFPQVPDENTPDAGGTPYASQRDANYALKGQANIYSPFNYYLIRDNMDIPEVILTAAEVSFIRTEAYLRGLGVAQDVAIAEGEYLSGLFSSIKFWQNVKNNSTMWVNASPDISDQDIFALINNHPRLSIFATEDKLKLLYKQRWLDAFRQSWEAYSLERRTKQTPRMGEALSHFRFKYPPSEVINNPENWAAQIAAMGSDEENVKVWWMP